jgi:hypothetical protein
MADLAARAKRDPALMKRVLANPNLRYKLPTSMLSVAQRRSRTNAQAAKASTRADAALNDPTTPLAGANLAGIAQKIVNGQYDPQTAALDHQGSQAVAQGAQAIKTTGGIYDQIAKYQTAALNQQNAQQAAGAQATAGLASAASGQVDAAAMQQRAQAARDAQIRGTGLDGGSLDALAARVATAKDSIGQRGQIAGDNLAANAQTNNAVLGGIGAATQQHGGESQVNIGNATRGTLADLASKRQGVATAKGGAYADDLMKLRQQATDEYYTSAGLGLKSTAQTNDVAAKKAARTHDTNQAAKDRATTTANQKASRDAQNRKWGRTVIQKYGVTNAQWYQWGKTPAGLKKREAAIAAAKASGGKGPKGKSPFVPIATQNAAKDTIDGARSLIAQLKAAGHSQAEIRATLLTGQPADKKTNQPLIKPVNKDYLNAAMDLAYLGGLSPANVTALRRRGIKVKQLGYGKPKDPGTVATSVGNAVNNTLGLG